MLGGYFLAPAARIVIMDLIKIDVLKSFGVWSYLKFEHGFICDIRSVSDSLLLIVEAVAINPGLIIKNYINII